MHQTYSPLSSRLAPDFESPTEGGGATADAARETLAELDERFRALVTERPVLTLVAAVAAGFVLGKLVSRI